MNHVPENRRSFLQYLLVIASFFVPKRAVSATRKSVFEVAVTDVEVPNECVRVSYITKAIVNQDGKRVVMFRGNLQYPSGYKSRASINAMHAVPSTIYGFARSGSWIENDIDDTLEFDLTDT